MRILLVEDDKDLQRLLKKALTDSGYVVDTANDGEEGHFLGDTEPYDAVILDLGLPKMDGVRVLEKWRKDGKTMPVLILTARDRWSDKVAGFDAGADDYLAKPFHFEEVLARVRALSRRQQGPQARVLQAGNLSMDGAARQVMVGGDVVPTTRREYELLELFLRHPAQVLSKEQIHDAVWGDGQTLDSGLVEVYAGKVRRKLAAARADVAIETCRGIGYRLVTGEFGAL